MARAMGDRHGLLETQLGVGWRAAPYFLHDSRDSRATAVRERPIFYTTAATAVFFIIKNFIYLD